MYIWVPSTILFSATVSAAFIPIKRVDEPTVWTSPNGGNTQVRFGDAKVYVGSCKPSDVINSVKDNCYDQGFCNSKAWTMQCRHGDAGSHTITITAPEGQYQASLKQGLIDAMNAAIATDKVTESKEITAMSGGGCTGCA
jgi:hypothetical protein